METLTDPREFFRKLTVAEDFGDEDGTLTTKFNGGEKEVSITELSNEADAIDAAHRTLREEATEMTEDAAKDEGPDSLQTQLEVSENGRAVTYMTTSQYGIGYELKFGNSEKRAFVVTEPDELYRVA
jgi:hypothetical protein